MTNKSFFSRLKKLFSTSSIIHDPKTNKIKVIDVDKLQATNNYESNRLFNDKFFGIRNTAAVGLFYNPTYGFHALKHDLYRDYEEMDQDSILASALDIYADESTMKNENDEVLKITSSKDSIRETLTNLFYDVLNIEFNLWPWVRNLCKYGDMYLKLDIVESIGVVNAIPLSPYYVSREEDPNNPDNVVFYYDAVDGIYVPNHRGKRIFENYEIAHFRLISDTNFLPYGKSILEPARKVWGQLSLMEDAMMIHRIMRAPQKRVFKIDIGSIPPNEVSTYMNQVINKMKKVPYIDEQTGNYNLRFNLQNMLEDFYIPVRGNQSGTDISDLGGMEWTGIDDIEYLRNKMMAALKVPKAFLGYEEQINAKATLAAEDVRFARTIERIQRIIVSELTKIAIVHLYSQGYTDMDLVDFTLELTTSSTIYEIEKLELWVQKVQLARDAKELKLVSNDWVYENIFKFSAEQIEEEKEKIIEDVKRQFRLSQIETEGNDPAVTNESFGTSHDLAIIDYAKQNGVYDENNDIKKKIDARTISLSPGRKAFQEKSLAHDNERRNIRHKFRGNSPLKQEQLEKKLKQVGIKNFKINKRHVIKEINDNDDGTFLDEKNIL